MMILQNTHQLIRQPLLDYYHQQARSMPWRDEVSPYRTWISEIMLQQTQVVTVHHRFLLFMKRFPTIASIAQAGERAICEEWAGLGYYQRARNIYKTASIVMQEHGGDLPSSHQELLRLPGIGRYTAGAIGSIAFGNHLPVVDGNVIRVYARLHADDTQAKSPVLAKRVWAWAEKMVQGEQPRAFHPGDLNQALMELGATVCTPKKPSCQKCPVQKYCKAYGILNRDIKNNKMGVFNNAGMQGVEQFPGVGARTAQKNMRVAFLWHRVGGALLLSQRPLSGLWSGLWELPSAHGVGAKKRLSEDFGVRLGSPLVTLTHHLTHRRIEARVYMAKEDSTLKFGSGNSLTANSPNDNSPNKNTWVRSDIPLERPLSGLARKAILASLKMLGN